MKQSIFLLFYSCGNTNSNKSSEDITITDIYIGKIANGKKQTITIKCTNNSSKKIKLREINIPCPPKSNIKYGRIN